MMNIFFMYTTMIFFGFKNEFCKLITFFYIIIISQMLTSNFYSLVNRQNTSIEVCSKNNVNFVILRVLLLVRFMPFFYCCVGIHF